MGNTDNKGGKAFVQLLNKVLFKVSMLILVLLGASLILKWTGIFILPQVGILNFSISVLIAATVGYITNYLAILLLFRPYEPVRWLRGYRGVIPSRQNALAKCLGEEIPKNLLPPEEIADQLSVIIKGYLQDTELLNEVRQKVTAFTHRYRSEIANFILPHIEAFVGTAIKENLTREKLEYFLNRYVSQWLNDPGNRQWLSLAIAGELRRKSPELTQTIRSFVVTGTRNYMREEHPILTGLLSADEIAAGLVDYLNWDRIQVLLCDQLGTSETQEMLSDELLELSSRLKQFLQSEDLKTKIDQFSEKCRSEVESFVRSYLEERIPEVVDSWLARDDFWETIEKQVLPTVQALVLHQLKRDREGIIAGLNLSGRIENAINQLKPKEIHDLINKVSSDELAMLQILGFILGGVIGAGMFFLQ